jgi:hypothetical protein
MEGPGHLVYAEREPTVAEQLGAITAVARMPEGPVKAGLAHALCLIVNRANFVIYRKGEAA